MKRLYVFVLMVMAFGPLITPSGSAQTNPAGTGSGITRQQGDAILSELRQIRQLLEKMAAANSLRAEQPERKPGTVEVQVGNGPSLGPPDAPLTMVEFTDYQCFFCRQFYLNTFPEIKKKYVDTGKLRYVVRDFPLSIHSDAMLAAEAAHCAAAQGQYWPMRHDLMTKSNLSEAAITGYAQSLSLDMTRYRACLRSKKYQPEIQRSMEQASAIDIGGTPTFVLGRSTPDGVVGTLIEGALPFADFETKINAWLAKTR